ncbi:hypothetical protein MLD38_011841 [Melastoma candidum]|uniref:Uncharacterized protein n=1 Tax=Melastoma candidum TaxID=119954 RepID=A0ACB9R5P5_9MYRT|nr:hypothetical protein MLD38_011841 [Melastoma candidum]
MRTSLRKLRVLGGGGVGAGGAGSHHSSKHRRGFFEDRKDALSFNQFDELDHACQDLEDMKDCYDNLLSAAAATTNSAYEFSESLRELGACLLEKTALSDDEDSGKVLLMLGKVQYELQRLLDIYRSHITRTITVPSQSLLNELRTVEEMKYQCDEKRTTYEYMICKQKEKNRSKSGKGENFSMQQLQDAHEQFDEEVTLFMFRLKSLKQGQSRSLLTQAARHHAAQLRFFKKALKSLEGVEPHVEYVTEQQHIDYPFDGLDDEDDDDMDDDSYDTNDDGELSFDYAQSHTEGAASPIQQSMELDQADLTFPATSMAESPKVVLERNTGEKNLFLGGGTQSAPLLADRKSEPIEKPIPVRQFSTRKLQTYVLPTPVGNSKNSSSSTSINRSPTLRQSSLNWQNQKLWHSTPLEPKRQGKSPADVKHSRNPGLGSSIIFKETNQPVSSPLPPPLKEEFPFSKHDPFGGSSYKKMRRQSLSGPLSNKKQPFHQVQEKSPILYSGSTFRNLISMSQPFSSPPKVSPASSPPLTSPKISELHELPRPPANSGYASSRTAGLVGYSAPLVSRAMDRDISGKHEGDLPTIASPLPIPPLGVSRSLSIPASASRGMELLVPKLLDMPQNSETSGEVFSPPLTPITLPRIRLPINPGVTQPVSPLAGTN